MTQAEQVLAHLRTGRKITAVEAASLYGIQRLAAVVNRINRKAPHIHRELRKGVRANYAEYSLIVGSST